MFKVMNISKQNKLLLLSFLVFIVFFMIYVLFKQENKPATSGNFAADTFIPKGLVLIPIELLNYASVSALIDQFAVIDLYAGSPQNTGSVKVASRIKMVRAPNNPMQFAVLVAEQKSSDVMKYPGPFWAVIQNRQAALPIDASPAESIENNKIRHRQIKIEYYKEGT